MTLKLKLTIADAIMTALLLLWLASVYYGVVLGVVASLIALNVAFFVLLKLGKF